MEAAELIEVEIVYALPERQTILPVRVPSRTTVACAILESGLLERFPEIDLAHAKLGIFGRRVEPEHVLRAGDRIEIYRELIADPKTARRKRAGRIEKS